MSLSTVRAEAKRSDLLFGGLGKLARIQRSFQTEIDDSCPTLLITLFLIIHLADTILSQPYDDEYECMGSDWLVFLKYRPLNTLENNVC